MVVGKATSETGRPCRLVGWLVEWIIQFIDPLTHLFLHTAQQINNTRLLVVHVFIDAVTVHFTASLLYYERKVGAGASSTTTKQEQQHEQPQHRHHRHNHHDSGDRGGAGSITCGLSLYKLMVIDIAQLALAIILLGVQMTSFFSNQYVYIIPVTMAVSEIYVHFKGGKRESAGPAR